MPEPDASGATPAAAPVTTPAPAATNTSPDPQAGDGNSDQLSLEEAKKLRKEAQALRARLKTLEDADQAAKDAQLSEIDLTRKQLAALQEEHESLAAELAEARVRQDVADLAAKFNFIVSPKTITNLLLVDFEAIEFADGKPTNIEKLLDTLAKSEPDLVKKPAQAEPAQANQIRTPSVPAMNPGRASITSPAGNMVPGRIPRLTDIEWKK